MNVGPQVNIAPMFWAPGQSYNIVLTNPQGYFYAYTPQPGYVQFTEYVLTAASYNAGIYYSEDPSVTTSNEVYVSPTVITFNVAVAANAPTETDGFSLWCPGERLTVSPGFIYITPCALPVTPVITSIQPSSWIAGQPTTITITGTGFIPMNNANSCAPSGLAITAGSENVAITKFSVPSATQIIATVTPQASDPAETATLTVSNGLLNGPPYYATATATAQISPDSCPVPTVSSISPNVWFAGQSSNNVIIKGKNFTTAAKATATCPATTINVSTPSQTVVVLGAVTVNSATQITIASVAPPASEPNERASVTVSGNTTNTYSTRIENPQPSIATLQYTNSLPVWLDDPGTTPVAMSQTVWPVSTPTVRSVFVSGNKINATATFNVTPLTSALSGARIEGSVSNGLGLLVASGVSIPAGATSITVNLTGDTAFPPSQTQHYQPLGVTWSFSPGGQPCSSGPSLCESAGSTSSEVYVTLATPLPFSEPTMTVMPLTAVELAIGDGGATNQTQAFNNTWQNFAGPANVTGWDTRSLPYYYQGVMALANATDAYELLVMEDGYGNQVQTETGQCGSFAHLLIDALAVNGIPSSFIQIQPTDKSSMLINNWTYNTASDLYEAPYNWNLTLPIETYVTPGDGTLLAPGMVPIPSGSVFGDLTSDTGLSGQNSATPAEKLFALHFIVQAPSGLGGGYYDPSYGVTYVNNCDFESKSVAGYALPASTNSPTASTWNFGVEQPTGSCNITFTTVFTN